MISIGLQNRIIGRKGRARRAESLSERCPMEPAKMESMRATLGGELQVLRNSGLFSKEFRDIYF
jgi:hypothetical protein